MEQPEVAAKYVDEPRVIKPAEPGDAELGPLKLLPGEWRSEGRGWNMIALPFDASQAPNFRVLMNQYNEVLTFALVDKGVPNRGIATNPDADADQFVVTLDYEQRIDQIAVEDNPASDKGKQIPLPIHHEPGLWLHMLNETTNGLDIARLGTIPHGNSVLALGRSEIIDGPPAIPPLNGLPIGAGNDLDSVYLAPYKHFEVDPFVGTVPEAVPGFPGFHPLDLNAILNFALGDGSDVTRTTILEVDSMVEKAGVVNIPFIKRQADAASMKSTFWIQELDQVGEGGEPKLRLQYSQVVILDFFERRDGLPGLIRWPHVSINTLDKVSNEPSPEAATASTA